MTSDLRVIATSWMRSPWSQVVTATDGFTRMALGVGISLVVWNRTSLTFSRAAYSLKMATTSWIICLCFLSHLWSPLSSGQDIKYEECKSYCHTYCCISWCVSGSWGQTPWPGLCGGFWLEDRGRKRSLLRISSTSHRTHSGCRFQHEMVCCRMANNLPNVAHLKWRLSRYIST